MLYYLSLGSNLGERERTLRKALDLIGRQIGTLLRCSSLYYSAPWGFESEHPFCNLCCAVRTDLAPLDMLRATQAIERQLGRTEKSSDGEYHDRTIDIDLIRAFDDEGKEIRLQITNHKSQMSNAPLLSLPHPLWQQRDFVVEPMKEIFNDSNI
ncbi:MAG: 2-amino-4-hydroxy-6-hydroxymethyldihydropteridine diphosphokinase [Paludibacteraceae bacterium]|nr:2-amino-4-hydroxy-6-hydroxymethyldihydropteridine diphosphokinase [Paludibacteraceae bacterium]